MNPNFNTASLMFEVIRTRNILSATLESLARMLLCLKRVDPDFFRLDLKKKFSAVLMCTGSIVNPLV